MLNGRSPWPLHLAQNVALIFIGFLFLPLDTSVLLLSFALRLFSTQDAARRRVRRSCGFRPKTILVTGLGMSKGLALARMFYLAGHDVVGADFEPFHVPVCGRFSKALKKFYALPMPNEHEGSFRYVQDLLNIVRREQVDIWVSCSGVTSAVDDGNAREVIERRSDCKAIQFDTKTTATLHEKHTFIQRTTSLGLPAPETYDVTTRSAVHKLLSDKPKKKYIMKSVGIDDTVRADMTILPRRTISETYGHLARIPISKEKPWVLQQYIQGEEYCTHALVIAGEVKAFVACPSLELLMHYEALPSGSALSRAMLRFTQEFVARSGEEMTGHLSFDFMVEETLTEDGLQKSLYPIECNPRAHTAVVLFNSCGTQMSTIYLDAVHTKSNDLLNSRTTNGHNPRVLVPQTSEKYYWIGHDLVELVLLPALQMVRRQVSFAAFLSSCYVFLEHLVLWKDGTFEVWDPSPWWCLYHVYCPGQFLACIFTGRKWSRINVSTTKMFVC